MNGTDETSTEELVYGSSHTDSFLEGISTALTGWIYDEEGNISQEEASSMRNGLPLVELVKEVKRIADSIEKIEAKMGETT